MAESYVSSAQGYERRIFSRCIFLVLVNFLPVSDDLGSRLDMGDELCELCTKIVDVRVIDLEEKEDLCLLRKPPHSVLHETNPTHQAE